MEQIKKQLEEMGFIDTGIDGSLDKKYSEFTVTVYIKNNETINLYQLVEKCDLHVLKENATLEFIQQFDKLFSE